jgi:hypothetical protein
LGSLTYSQICLWFLREYGQPTYFKKLKKKNLGHNMLKIKTSDVCIKKDQGFQTSYTHTQVFSKFCYKGFGFTLKYPWNSRFINSEMACTLCLDEIHFANSAKMD